MIANMFYKSKFYLILKLLSIFVLKSHQNEDTWSITFYTGTNFLSGTNSDIYFQLNGNIASSDLIIIKPMGRIKAGSVNRYYFNINKNIGKIESLSIRLQPSLPFLFGWNLFKADVIDSFNHTYTFSCDCWFKYSTPKRIIYLSNSEIDHTIENSQFSLAVGLLTILTFIVVFAYITNFLRKRWRNRLNLLNFNDRNIPLSRTQDALSTSHQVTLSPPESNTNNNTNINVTTNLLNDKNDSPPEYKDLFPDIPTPSNRREEIQSNNKFK